MSVLGKTPVSILQELMMKKNCLPYFDFVGSDGPPHMMKFTYRVTAEGITTEGTARSKKDAKQEAAKLCLEELEKIGAYKPERGPQSGHYGHTSPAKTQLNNDENEIGTTSPAALLKDLCARFTLGEPVYTLISDTGPAHAREFEVAVRVGTNIRSGIANTKKMARQLAAQQLVAFLHENLESVIKEYTSDELEERNKKASMKYAELRENNVSWRPNLGQRIADYHLGLVQYIETENLMKAIETMKINVADPVEKVEQILKDLNLEYEWTTLPSVRNNLLNVLNVPKSSPPMAWSGLSDKKDVALRALETLIRFFPYNNELQPFLQN